MANPIHRTNIETKDKRSQRKVADSTTKLAKTASTEPLFAASPYRSRPLLDRGIGAPKKPNDLATCSYMNRLP